MAKCLYHYDSGIIALNHTSIIIIVMNLQLFHTKVICLKLSLGVYCLVALSSSLLASTATPVQVLFHSNVQTAGRPPKEKCDKLIINFTKIHKKY